MTSIFNESFVLFYFISFNVVLCVVFCFAFVVAVGFVLVVDFVYFVFCSPDVTTNG